MEKTFYHPDMGVWTTTHEPPQDILDTYPEGTVEIPSHPGNGYVWDGLQWVEGHTEVDPLTVPLGRLDFWLAAAAAGVSKWSVRDRIAAMPEGPEKNAAIAYFEDAERYRRYDPLLIQMALAEGIDAERLDQLWREAVAASA